MEQKAAFLRARKFLNYYPVAKWSALVAAVGTGVLFLMLLLVLGLFIDLVVSRGDIPAYQNLSAQDQRAFRDDWKDPLKHLTAEQLVAALRALRIDDGR